ATCDDKSAQIYARFDKNDWRIQPAEFYRFHDSSYDADNRPLLVMRSNLWASGYDVDGTDQTSLGQFSGRVQQTYKHSVPRFFVPEHGTMFTLALVRFPPTATK